MSEVEFNVTLLGSTNLQIGGGAIGALIIEDDQIVDGIPDVVFSLPVVTVTLQHFDIWDLRNTANMCGDDLLSIQTTDNSELSDFYLVNGDLQPTISIFANDWNRFRMIHTSPTRNGILSFENCECEVLLLAKDGVYLPRVPRVVSQLFFTVSSRVDFAIRCSTVSVCNIMMNDIQIASLDVSEAPESLTLNSFQFPCWTPCFPKYLHDLRDAALSISGETINHFNTIEMGMSTINGYQFAGLSNILAFLPLEAIQQWDLVNTAEHPLHFHVNHFQIISEIDTEEVEGWTQSGDWIDTLANSLIVTVRFRPLDFEGDMLIHCHIPSHADQGAAALFHIVPRENHTTPSRDRRQTCGIEEC